MSRDQLRTALLALGLSVALAGSVIYEVAQDTAATWQQSTKPCAIPNCFEADGGWNDSLVSDCQFTGPLGLPDGGARWRGCNVGDKDLAVGTACLPVNCDSAPAAREALELRMADAGVSFDDLVAPDADGGL